MREFRSLLHLAWLTYRRELRSRKTAVALAFLVLLAALVVVAGYLRPWKPESFGRLMALELFGGFFVPVAALAYGTGALGDERDEKSLVHLLARPLPRAGIYLAKLLSVVPIALFLSLGGLWALGELAATSMQQEAPDLFGPFWPGILLSTFAYLSLFHLFAAAFRHSTVIGVGYVFFIEVFIGKVPGILKRVSIHFYANCVAFETARPIGVGLRPMELRFYLPIDGGTAIWVLVGLSAALILLGAWIFTRKEYHDAI